MLRAAPALLLLGTLPGCLSAEFSTLRIDQAPAEQAIEQLAIGMDLQQCLDLLGAPTSVRRDDEGIRTVLSWEWLEAGGYGLSLSVPLSEQASASVAYGTDSQQFRQIQVFLDTQLKVVDVSRDRTR